MTARQRLVPRHPRKPSSHRLGARSLLPYDLCQERGCKNVGAPVWLPWHNNKPEAVYCGKHAEEHGFCRGCGMFSAGLESFDWSKRRGFCSDCVAEMEREEARDRDDDDDTYDDEADYDAMMDAR